MGKGGPVSRMGVIQTEGSLARHDRAVHDPCATASVKPCRTGDDCVCVCAADADSAGGQRRWAGNWEIDRVRREITTPDDCKGGGWVPGEPACGAKFRGGHPILEKNKVDCSGEMKPERKKKRRKMQ